MFKNNFQDYNFAGRHGLVVEIQNGTEAGAKKIAEKFLAHWSCKNNAVEHIFNPVGNIWIFVWPESVSIDMPELISLIPQTNYWNVETLHDYIRNAPKK